MRGLARFKNRSVYANIVNDRSTVFYTTAISKIDPFPDPENTNFNYIKGYEDVVIDPERHVLPQNQHNAEEEQTFFSNIQNSLSKLWSTVTMYLFLGVLLPIGSVFFLLNAAIQHVLSQQRIKLYEQGKADLLPGRYRFPPIMQDMRGAVEDVFENLNASQGNEYLSEHDEEYSKQVMRQRRMSRQKSMSSSSNGAEKGTTDDEQQQQRPLQEQTEVDAGQDESEFPILALTPAQFEIIDSLNAIGFRKYPVYIHKVRHSHAAIIVRMARSEFTEGKIVVKHWLDNEFHL